MGVVCGHPNHCITQTNFRWKFGRFSTTVRPGVCGSAGGPIQGFRAFVFRWRQRALLGLQGLFLLMLSSCGNAPALRVCVDLTFRRWGTSFANPKRCNESRSLGKPWACPGRWDGRFSVRTRSWPRQELRRICPVWQIVYWCFLSKLRARRPVQLWLCLVVLRDSDKLSRLGRRDMFQISWKRKGPQPSREVRRDGPRSRVFSTDVQFGGYCGGLRHKHDVRGPAPFSFSKPQRRKRAAQASCAECQRNLLEGRNSPWRTPSGPYDGFASGAGRGPPLAVVQRRASSSPVRAWLAQAGRGGVEPSRSRGPNGERGPGCRFRGPVAMTAHHRPFVQVVDLGWRGRLVRARRR